MSSKASDLPTVAAGDLGEPSSSLNVRSFSFRCFMMMAVVVVAAEFDVEECVVVAVLAALLMPLPLAIDSVAVADCEQLPVAACTSVRSSFMARLASSVSVAAAVVDSGEVGEVVEVGDFSGIGISRSIDFWLTALCDSVERLSQICLVGSISIIETMVCRLGPRVEVTCQPGDGWANDETYDDD